MSVTARESVDVTLKVIVSTFLECPRCTEEHQAEDIYSDQIASVNFEPTEANDEEGEFSVHRSDGEENSWSIDWKPENALDDIQQRGRDDKRQTAKQ